MPKPDIQGHSMPLGELGMSFNDPSLLRGATAQLLIKNPRGMVALGCTQAHLHTHQAG